MNVVWLNEVKTAKEIQKTNSLYQGKIDQMDKLDLLTEMMRFQEERSQKGTLTLPLIHKGKILFKALEHRAETKELRQLARSYNRHLECELEVRKQAQIK